MQKYLLIIAITLTVILSLIAFRLSSKQSTTNTTPIQATISFPPAELLGHGARLPTAEELEQEKAFDAKQVQSAIEQLKSPDVHQRIVAAETLNAYRIPESERQLSDTMLHDDNAQVRQTAAQSLALFKNLSDRTVNSLFKALHDKDQQTRRESLNTLLNYTLQISDNTGKFQQVLKKLRNEVRSAHISRKIRTELKAFIKDQEPVKNTFLLPPPIVESVQQ